MSPSVASFRRQSEAKVYKMRELNQRTAEVIQEINQSRRPALVTKRGRFVALITPLASIDLESMVLQHLELPEPGDATVSADEVADAVGLNLGQ